MPELRAWLLLVPVRHRQSRASHPSIELPFAVAVGPAQCSTLLLRPF